ncbi:MAG TPA: hypothetical protein VLX92_17290 [Kofleriaceae bacterium]|nr:hypothetical protein [Kofleriaceae bacterium]
MRTVVLAVVAAAATAHAGAPVPEPSGPHPRILLDSSLRAAWRAQADEAHGPVKGAIAICDGARGGDEAAQYQGAEWAKIVEACLVAWAATDDKAYSATALRYTTALLDDLDRIGDGKGGDAAARRDDGYAIRNLGPYTALAYDWLHDQMSPAQRAHARERWKAWLDWWRDHGYRSHSPGTNYHAGYALAATFIAIAQGGEAGPDGAALWRDVADRIWSSEISSVLGDDGMLAGGDWPEGWQYGPLSVAEYALGARVMKRAGVDVHAERWLAALLQHHVYALSPGDGLYAGEDTESETANLEPSVLELDAIALGDAAPDDRRWARGELSRLKLTDSSFPLYDALAGVGDRPVLPPRAKWPTWYVAAGTGTLFARTAWDDRAVWLVTSCHAAIDADHRHPDAGNFVVSRGKDDVIVDPSPYGTQSTLTSNAPTVKSGHLPDNYKPSQGFWSTKTAFDFATQRASGTIAARCDYADQYRFQDQPSDVPEARRDLVLVPSASGGDAAIVVVDRADTGDAARGMYLRFRTPGKLALAGDTATATVGDSKLVIASAGRSSGTPALGAPSQKDCYKEGTVRGTCDAARFPVSDYRLELAGEKPSAVHVLSVVDAHGAPATVAPIKGDAVAGVQLGGVRDAAVTWRVGDGAYSYRARPGLQIALDGPEQGGTATVTAKPDGDGCAVTIAPGGTLPARPVTFALDARCAVAPDPEAASATPTLGKTPIAPAGDPRAPRSGCCGAQAAPGSPAAMAVVVGAIVLRRRRRRRR